MKLVDFLIKNQFVDERIGFYDDVFLKSPELLEKYTNHLGCLRKCFDLSIKEKIIFTKMQVIFIGAAKEMNFQNGYLSHKRNMEQLNADFFKYAPEVLKILEMIYAVNQDLNVA